MARLRGRQPDPRESARIAGIGLEIEPALVEVASDMGIQGRVCTTAANFREQLAEFGLG